MTMPHKDSLLLCSAVALGLGISSGHPLGMVTAAAMPLACLAPGTRKAAFKSAFGYYTAALWPMIPGLEAYWKSELLVPVLVWIFAAILLSMPWTIAWTADRIHYLWRAPLALLATVIPPLGVVGLASPLAGAGYLFPGTGWIGLTVVALLPGFILSTQAFPMRRRLVVLFFTSGTGMALSLVATLLLPRDPQVPRGWIAVSTHFGDVSRPFQDFMAAQFIQQKAADVPAHVLIFPESVVPRWSEATKAFWRQTLDHCRARGQIVVIGAGLPGRTGAGILEKLDAVKSYEFDAAIAVLRGKEVSHERPSLSAEVAPGRSVDNTMLVLGTESARFFQRVPVPIGMWRPFSTASVPLRLGAPGILPIDHQRAAVLICYEQMLTYPILASMLQDPTVIVGISNTFWVDHTPIPRYQLNALHAWAKLFRLPYMSATNS